MFEMMSCAPTNTGKPVTSNDACAGSQQYTIDSGKWVQVEIFEIHENCNLKHFLHNFVVKHGVIFHEKPELQAYV